MFKERKGHSILFPEKQAESHSTQVHVELESIRGTFLCVNGKSPLECLTRLPFLMSLESEKVSFMSRVFKTNQHF